MGGSGVRKGIERRCECVSVYLCEVTRVTSGNAISQSVIVEERKDVTIG